MNLVREPEARRRLGGISRTTFWRWRQEGFIPAPVRIGARNFWTSAELDAAISRLATPPTVKTPGTTVLCGLEVPDGLIN